MMRKLFFVVVFFSFCENAQSQNLKTQKGGHCYTVDVPTYMVKAFDLNDVATLQYQNTLKEAYTIVIEDEKANLQSLGLSFGSPKDFLEDFLAEYLVGAENRNLSGMIEFTANGNGHAQADLTWSSEGNNFYMLVTGVETETHFYKLLSWTLAENKPSLQNDFLAIAKSLKD